jgi:hypothetical protein
MFKLEADDKTTMVMAYTHNALFRGEVVTKQAVRVSIWLRTEGAPVYMHLLKPLVVTFGGSPIRPNRFPEVFVPISDVIAFHIVPPVTEPMDYEENEKNRMMQPIAALIGTFTAHGAVRISTQTALGTSLEVSRITWMSLYNSDVTNPFLPNMAVHVPMMLVRPERVAFALEDAPGGGAPPAA